jgi:methylenetetrahydrofolate reductase (NADPH)
VFSFEFFPPRSAAAETTLLRSLERLAPLEPDFVSVTYGAAGSERSRTLEIVARIKRQFGIEAVAHLTCVGASRAELVETIDRLGAAGIENILALRGDPPRGQAEFAVHPGGLRYACELIELVRSRGPFCVGAACYPEVHSEASDEAADLQNLKTKVEAGADFLITQLFFDNLAFFRFLARVRSARIDVPVLAGIMPVTNVAQVERFTNLCGATLPPRFLEQLRDVGDDPQEVFWTGVSYAARQCDQLLSPTPRDPYSPRPKGVQGIHFYTLNKSPATRAIFEILQLARPGLM